MCFLCFPLFKSTSWQDQTLANFKISCLGVDKDLHNLLFYGGFLLPSSCMCQVLHTCTTTTIIGTSLCFASLMDWIGVCHFGKFTHFVVSQGGPIACIGSLLQTCTHPAILGITLLFGSLKDWRIIFKNSEVLIFFQNVAARRHLPRHTYQLCS